MTTAGRWMIVSRVALTLAALSWYLGATSARACDLCGCYTPQLEALPQLDPSAPLGWNSSKPSTRHSWENGLYLGLAEQFTHFGTLQENGTEVANTTDQFLNSSITQFVAGYAITPRFALQLNLPMIYRSFARPEGFEIDRGTEAGVGDLSLLGRFVLWRTQQERHRGEPDFTASVVAFAGMKFPTGDSSRLKEEFTEEEIKGAPESGIHGHDLTLGTGSFDGIFGGQSSFRYQNAFFQADLQFTLRGDGSHQYHFANDITWSGGPGYYLIRRKETIFGVQCALSGEHKDVDRFRGVPAEDTGTTSFFVGPRLVASWRRFSGEIAVDLPVSIDNTALQVVPDYRLHGGVAVSF